jgi:hypothetical protein
MPSSAQTPRPGCLHQAQPWLPGLRRCRRHPRFPQRPPRARSRLDGARHGSGRSPRPSQRSRCRPRIGGLRDRHFAHDFSVRCHRCQVMGLFTLSHCHGSISRHSRGPDRGPSHRIIPAPRVPLVRDPSSSLQLARPDDQARPLIIRRSWVRAPPAPPTDLRIRVPPSWGAHSWGRTPILVQVEEPDRAYPGASPSAAPVSGAGTRSSCPRRHPCPPPTCRTPSRSAPACRLARSPSRYRCRRK